MKTLALILWYGLMTLVAVLNPLAAVGMLALTDDDE